MESSSPLRQKFDRIEVQGHGQEINSDINGTKYLAATFPESKESHELSFNV